MKTSELIADLFSALAMAQGDFLTVPTDANNKFFDNAPYATLNAYINMARPILAKYNLAVIQGVDERGKLITKLIHKSGQWIETETELINKKGDMQGLGSALTYARKYSLASILNIASKDEDDDGNGSTLNTTKKEYPKTTPAPAKPTNETAPIKSHTPGDAAAKAVSDIQDRFKSIHTGLRKLCAGMSAEQREKYIVDNFSVNWNAIGEGVKKNDLDFIKRLENKMWQLMHAFNEQKNKTPKSAKDASFSLNKGE